MNHLFVPYEIAISLKEKGFNEPCFAGFFTNIEGKLLTQLPENEKELFIEINSEQAKPENCARPLYQQVIDWFREKHQIELVQFAIIDKRSWEYCWQIIAKKTPLYDFCDKDYYECLNKLFTESLKLI